jgi:hypothetical protein
MIAAENNTLLDRLPFGRPIQVETLTVVPLLKGITGTASDQSTCHAHIGYATMSTDSHFTAGLVIRGRSKGAIAHEIMFDDRRLVCVHEYVDLR